ncbi:MAG: hypothetical protein ACI8XV_000383 [Arenicella sp.]
MTLKLLFYAILLLLVYPALLLDSTEAAESTKNELTLADVSQERAELSPDKNLIELEMDLTEPYGNRSKTATCVFNSNGNEWIDGVREQAHLRLCRSVSWVDGLFGDKYEFDDDEFSGKLSLGFRHDETEGFDPRLRVRIKSKLPNVSTRLNAFVGRVEEDSFVSNTEVAGGQVTTVGLRSADDDDDEWLVGLGYRNPNARSNGFDYSVGAKISSGLNPYVKVAHRHLFPVSESRFWRTTQTVFWRGDDGFGVSSNLDFTQLLSDRDILEWDTSTKFTEDSDQWEWISSTAWHHSFSKVKGISSRAYMRGEENTIANIPEFGLTFTYVQPFLRPWLLVETGVDFRWEKFDGNEEYKSAVRFGIQFQMVLGDYYSRLKEDYRNR